MYPSFCWQITRKTEKGMREERWDESGMLFGCQRCIKQSPKEKQKCISHYNRNFQWQSDQKLCKFLFQFVSFWIEFRWRSLNHFIGLHDDSQVFYNNYPTWTSRFWRRTRQISIEKKNVKSYQRHDGQSHLWLQNPYYGFHRNVNEIKNHCCFSLFIEEAVERQNFYLCHFESVSKQHGSIPSNWDR